MDEKVKENLEVARGVKQCAFMQQMKILPGKRS